MDFNFPFLDTLVLPVGATTGIRIEIDGVNGEIRFYDENDLLVGFLSPEVWEIGDLTTPGDRITLDPSGGLRIRNAEDILVSTLDQQGYTLRDTDSGLVVAEIRSGHIRIVDPDGSDDIELTTSSQGGMPNPVLRQSKEASPGATVAVPLAPVFTSTPADDISIGHVAAWLRNTVQASTWTPPGGWTERVDDDASPDDSTLAVSVATLAATTGAAGTFTNTQNNWQHGLGSHVIVRGGGAASPSFQSESHTDGTDFFTGTSYTLSMAPPSGTLTDRILVAFVALGNDGGGVPTGWKAPDGWVFLGATFMFTGSGTTLSTLAVGAWAKLGTASEPLTYEVPITIGAGRKTIYATIIAIADPFLIEGGAHIRIAGHPIRRVLDFVELEAANATLCDFQNIPQGYDHLELIYDCESDISTDIARRIFMRMNNDSGANYHRQVTSDGVITTALNATNLNLGAVDGQTAGHRSSGQVTLFDYRHTGEERSMVGHCLWVGNINLLDDSVIGYWNNTADGINRLTLGLPVGAGNVKFATGGRAYLYGY